MSLPSDFLKLPARRDYRRLGLETLCAFAAAGLMAQERGGVNFAPETRLAPTSVEVPTVGEDGTYRLPAHYAGLTALEDRAAGTVKLIAGYDERRPAYEFDLSLKLAFRGEAMYDADGPRIPPDLRRDYYTVLAAFCARAAGGGIDPASRAAHVCAGTEARGPG